MRTAGDFAATCREGVTKMIKDGKSVCDRCEKEFSPQPSADEQRKREEEEREGRPVADLCAECTGRNFPGGVGKLFPRS